MVAARTRYVRNGEVSIAYQVIGGGPLDLVIIPGFISHLELEWGNALYSDFLRALASFARLLRFDKRGTGLSDPVAGLPTLEERMEDAHAVMDAAGVERAAILGISEGGPMAALFAATYPERVSALVLYGTFANGEVLREHGPRLAAILDEWGEGRITELFAPSLVNDQNLRRIIGTWERSAASPAMARAVIEAFMRIDVRDILPAVRVPTLVVHREGELVCPLAGAREVAEAIPGARLAVLPGNDHAPWVGDSQGVVDVIEEFLTGARHVRKSDRVLATVLFTDIVDSTGRAAGMGDAAWRALLEQHDALARAKVEEHRGRVVKTLGDGLLATFDGPARAIRCAEAVRDGVKPLGISIRAGVHTGECEAIGDDLGGLAVHIGSRVGSMAAAGEVLVSSTVKELVVGSGLTFDDAGEHELKGVPGPWRLFRVGAERAVQPDLEPAAKHMTRGDRAIVRLSRRLPGATRALSRITIKERPTE
jgi:class 3 adenylate cyclase